MLTFLRNILEAILYFPQYVLLGVETLVNLFFSGVQGLVDGAAAVLPDLPVVGPPSFLPQINWVYPIGALVPLLTTMVTAYVAFLAVRWIYKWAGEL